MNVSVEISKKAVRCTLFPKFIWPQGTFILGIVIHNLESSIGTSGKDLRGPFQVLELGDFWVWGERAEIDNLENQAQEFEVGVEAAA